MNSDLEWMKIAQRRADKLVILAEALEGIIDLCDSSALGSECQKIAKEALKKYRGEE